MEHKIMVKYLELVMKMVNGHGDNGSGNDENDAGDIHDNQSVANNGHDVQNTI